jgi:hypothetical protein
MATVTLDFPRQTVSKTDPVVFTIPATLNGTAVDADAAYLLFRVKRSLQHHNPKPGPKSEVKQGKVGTSRKVIFGPLGEAGIHSFFLVLVRPASPKALLIGRADLIVEAV